MSAGSAAEVGARLRALREAPPYWSRTDLARRLRAAADPADRDRLPHVPSLATSIKQWETGKHRPGHRYRRLLSRVFDSPEHELFGDDGAGVQQLPSMGRSLDGPAAMIGSSPVYASPASQAQGDHRSVGASAENPPVVVALGNPVQIMLQTHALTSSNVDPQVLETIRDSITRIVDRYELLGPRPLAGELTALRSTLHALIQGQQLPGERRELFRTAGQVSALLGYASVNCARPDLADAYCREAQSLAEHVQDVALQQWIAGTRSFDLYYRGDYAAADAAAEAGIALAPRSPQAIRLLANGRARALARMDRHAQQGAERALGQAMALTSRHDAELPTGVSSCVSLGPYSLVRTLANAVTARVSMNRVDAALADVEMIQDDVEQSTSPWTQGLVRLDVAAGLLRTRQPDVEQAADLGRAALAVTAAAPIRSVAQRARELADRIGPWRDREEAAAYVDDFRLWNAASAASSAVSSW